MLNLSRRRGGTVILVGLCTIKVTTLHPTFARLRFDWGTGREAREVRLGDVVEMVIHGATVRIKLLACGTRAAKLGFDCPNIRVVRGELYRESSGSVR